MSEPNSGFDFAVLKEAGLDVSELFGAGAPGGNPFATAPQPAEAQAMPQTAAQTESVSGAQEVSPVAPQMESAAPVHPTPIVPMQTTAPVQPAPDPIAAAFAVQCQRQ